MDNNQKYVPHPMDTSHAVVPDELNELIDYLAGNAHDVWAKGRMSQGITYGESADSSEKKNPFLKPYDCMTPTEKLADINSVEETLKFIISNGYKIEKKDNTHWGQIERKYFKKYHSDKEAPLYKAPLVVGLVGEMCPSLDSSKMQESIDDFASHIFSQFDISPLAASNSERGTPVYIISEFANDTEIAAAAYACEKYKFELISINSSVNSSSIRSVTAPGSAVDYITQNSFMLLALWDGIEKNNRAGSAVRKALLEHDKTSDAIENTVIDDSHAVYHIVLPGKADPKFYWKSRLLLPYVLESGESWFTLKDAVILKDKSGNDVIMGQTAATVVNGSINGIIKQNIKQLKAQYKQDCKQLDSMHSADSRRKLLQEAGRKELSDSDKAHINRLIKIDDKAYKDEKASLKRKLSKNIKREKAKKSYNDALEKSKKNRYENNCRMFGYINNAIALGEKTKKPTQEYDLLNESIHGKSLCADAVNLRHLKIDTIATLFQKAKKVQTTFVALFAGIGLSAYGIFSDLASSRSLIGILGGLVSVAAIIAALVIFMLSQRKDYHSTHLNLRLLSEMLRVKTYLNAARIYDTDVSELLTERQQQELEWAQFIYRGWGVVDSAAGYYKAEYQKPISFDSIRKLWIGSADTLLDGKSNTKVYVPSADSGQMDFDRGRGSEYFKKAGWLSAFKTFASVLTVIATIVIVIMTFVVFLNNAGEITTESFGDLFTDRFTAGSAYTVAETILVFCIGIIPSIIACALIFHESQMYSENALRYKWMAVKYQKLTSCLDGAIGKDDDAVRKIFNDAARAAVEEIGEWTLMTANSDTALPF